MSKRFWMRRRVSKTSSPSTMIVSTFSAVCPRLIFEKNVFVLNFTFCAFFLFSDRSPKLQKCDHESPFAASPHCSNALGWKPKLVSMQRI